MTLADTINNMLSEDYSERFKAEYNQLTIRLERLENVISKAEANDVTFNNNKSLEILKAQRETMQSYKKILETRADNEGIRL